MPDLPELLAGLTPDPKRAEVGFTAELDEFNALLFGSTTDAEVEQHLGRWLASNHQSCLFGRLAAKRSQLTYCILREADFALGSTRVSAKIQDARLRWTAEGFHGLKSGFIVYVLSERIANALPDGAMFSLAAHLAELYLLEPISVNQIALDEIFLDTQTTPPATWRWSAGVNYFSAQGDNRWWQDHRIPAGMAFSVNSVGHMAKSGLLASARGEFWKALDLPDPSTRKEPLTSLLDALQLAMMTIDRASDTKSGKATTLLPLPGDVRELAVHPCPIPLPAPLDAKDYCTYSGFYHTDVTLPAEYFCNDVERPPAQAAQMLDFTYLFDSRPENVDYALMGRGRRIRGTGAPASALKQRRTVEDTVPVEQSPRLVEALRRYPRPSL